MKIFDNIEKIVAFGLTVFWFGLACGDVGQHFDAGYKDGKRS